MQPRGIFKDILAFVTAMVVIIVFFVPRQALAQRTMYDPRTEEQKIYFPRMDSVLIGMWQGMDHTDRGMQADAQAIACMVKMCEQIRRTYPNNKEEWGRARYFTKCYQEHKARIADPSFKPVKHPPRMPWLTCEFIQAQTSSDDDEIYEAVNGYPRPQPERAPLRVADEPQKPKRHTNPLNAEDARRIEVELNRMSSTYLAAPVVAASVKSDENPYAETTLASADIPKVADGMPFLPAGFDLVGENDKRMRLYVHEGADSAALLNYLRLRNASHLNKGAKYAEKARPIIEAGSNKLTIPFCRRNGKRVFDDARMHVKSWDKAALDGPPNKEFLASCSDEDLGFALQGKQVISIPAMGDQIGEIPPVANGNSQPAENGEAKAADKPSVDPSTAASATIHVDQPAVVSSAVQPVPTTTASAAVINSAEATKLAEVDVRLQPAETNSDATAPGFDDLLRNRARGSPWHKLRNEGPEVEKATRPLYETVQVDPAKRNRTSLFAQFAFPPDDVKALRLDRLGERFASSGAAVNSADVDSPDSSTVSSANPITGPPTPQ